MLVSENVTENFWQDTPLASMTQQKWESLCDHCGLCCLVRIEDEDSGEVFDTNVICRHYDCDNNTCSSYGNRTQIDHGCVQLTPELVREFDWLPDSCAYRVVMRGEPLPETHPLISGKRNSSPNVTQIFQHIGVIQDNSEVIHEHHLIASDILSR